MKFSSIIFFTVALLASTTFSAPTADYKNCDDSLSLSKPKDSSIYKVNSTHVVELAMMKDHCYDKDTKVTYEIFSLGRQAVVDTIIEQENLHQVPKSVPFLVDKVWAKENAKYFVIGTIFKGCDPVFTSKSGTFITKV